MRFSVSLMLNPVLSLTFRLWHQLTVALEDLVKSPHFEKSEDLVGLYEHFIRDFETKLNQLSLAKIVVQISRRITGLHCLIA